MPIEFRDGANAGLTTLSFSGVIPGSATASQEVRVWNSMGSTTAATVYGPQLIVAVEWPVGSGTWVYSGAPPVDERWLEVSISGSDGVTVAATDWRPTGTGCAIDLPDLAKDTAVYTLQRVRPPAGTTVESGTVRFKLVPVAELSLALSRGGSETGADGVLRWIGDTSVSALLVGSTYTESGPVGSSIECPYEAAVLAGLPVAYAAGTVTVNNLDSAAAALGSGEEYRFIITLKSDGTRTVTKGPKAAIGTAVAPVGPAGELLRAEVLRQFDGLINNTDITMHALPGRFSYLSSSGPVVTLGPGEVRADNRLLRYGAVTQLTLEPSSTNWTWVQPAGLWAVTQTADAPVPGAALIWEFDTDGSGVTATRDRRIFVGGLERSMKLLIGDAPIAAADVSAPDVVSDPKGWYLDPERCVWVGLTDQGTGTTSAATRMDLQFSDAGAAYASIYPDTASMPSVAYNAADPTASTSRPDVLVVPGGSRVQSRVDAIPGGGTAPSGVTVVLQGVVR